MVIFSMECLMTMLLILIAYRCSQIVKHGQIMVATISNSSRLHLFIFRFVFIIYKTVHPL